MIKHHNMCVDACIFEYLRCQEVFWFECLIQIDQWIWRRRRLERKEWEGFKETQYYTKFIDYSIANDFEKGF